MKWRRLAALISLVAAIRSPAEAAPAGLKTSGAPSPPAVLAPAPSSTLTSMPPDLTVSASDPDDDSLSVTFYGRPLATAGPDFTLVEIPDTQYYTSSMNGGSPSHFMAQTQWIVANRLTRNIAYIAHVGDIVQNQDNNGNPIEWVAGDACMRPLESPDLTLLPEGIPYGISPGNHDIAGTGAVTLYGQYFGAARFQGRSYYGGHFGNDNANWYELFSASGLDFIVIGFNLMWVQDPAVVHWADSLLTAHPNRRAIVVSHYLLDPGPPVTFSPQGQAIYDGLKGHANLILMLCGHYVDEARRSDTYNGHTVHTVMANYQNREHGGDGWLRIMEFSPAHNHVRMRTYSPTLGRFEVDADSSSQFTLPLDLSGGDTAFHPIATARVPSGSTVSIPWAGLARDGSYEWYASADDGSTTASSPAWQFRTVEAIPPTVEVTTPNGSEAVVMGQQAVIQWNAADASGILDVDVLLSRNGILGPFEELVHGIPNTGSFSWWVTGPTTNSARVEVRARDGFLNENLDASDGPFSILGPVGVEEGPAGSLALDPVAPNPTHGRARFGVTLPAPAAFRLTILDIGGREVVVLANGFQAAGRRELEWDGRARGGVTPAGLYFVRLEAMGRVLTRRFTLAP